MSKFKCLRVYPQGSGTEAKLESTDLNTLTAGDVTLRSLYSGINFKDALAVTGKGKILKSLPLIPGIDVCGEVLTSKSKKFKKGDKVILNGCNTGEINDGGFSEVVRASSENLVPLPKGLTPRDAMLLGTAGFTAALALSRMETMGQEPKKGPIVITGASGGVGSFATQIFSRAGYEVIAVSGKKQSHDYLLELGADQVVSADELKLGSRPLEAARFGGVVDSVGGELLTQLIAHVQLWGNVACVGLAASHELKTTVMPLILRGVSLLGVSSNNTGPVLRKELWKKLAKEWKPKKLSKVLYQEIALQDVPRASEELLERKVQGRFLIKY